MISFNIIDLFLVEVSIEPLCLRFMNVEAHLLCTSVRSHLFTMVISASLISLKFCLFILCYQNVTVSHCDGRFLMFPGSFARFVHIFENDVISWVQVILVRLTW